MSFRRGDLPEPAPAGWGELGLHPSYRLEVLKTRAEVDARCRALGVNANDTFNDKMIGACVSPEHLVAVLQDRPGDPVRAAADKQHEFPHSWGLRHQEGGKKWLTPDGKPAGPLSPMQAQMMQAMARAQAAQVQPPPDPARGLLSLGQTAPTAPR